MCQDCGLKTKRKKKKANRNAAIARNKGLSHGASNRKQNTEHTKHS